MGGMRSGGEERGGRWEERGGKTSAELPGRRVREDKLTKREDINQVCVVCVCFFYKSQ